MPGLSALPITRSISDRKASLSISPCKPRVPSFEPVLLALRLPKLSYIAGTQLQRTPENKFWHLSHPTPCSSLNVPSVHPSTSIPVIPASRRFRSFPIRAVLQTPDLSSTPPLGRLTPPPPTHPPSPAVPFPDGHGKE